MLRSENLSGGKWTLADVVVSRENVEVSLPMSQAVEINGRIIAAEGVALPKFQEDSIMMRARLGNLLGWASVGSADSQGKFVMKGLPLLPHDVNGHGIRRRPRDREVDLCAPKKNHNQKNGRDYSP